MPTSKPASVLSVENPVALIRSRIKEKRIFEARFLCRQLGDTIGEREKIALEGELAGFLSRVDTLQQQARTLLAEGQKDRAFALYREMEAIAIDIPGLAEEKRALEGAEAIIARLAVKTLHSSHRQHRLAAALVARNATKMEEQDSPFRRQIPASEEEQQGVAVSAARRTKKKTR